MFEVKTAAIIGGGVIGGGWSARLIENGIDVRVFDPAPDAETKLRCSARQCRAGVCQPDQRSLH